MRKWYEKNINASSSCCPGKTTMLNNFLLKHVLWYYFSNFDKVSIHAIEGKSGPASRSKHATQTTKHNKAFFILCFYLSNCNSGNKMLSVVSTIWIGLDVILINVPCFSFLTNIFYWHLSEPFLYLYQYNTWVMKHCIYLVDYFSYQRTDFCWWRNVFTYFKINICPYWHWHYELRECRIESWT